MADPTVDEIDAFIAEWKTLDGFLPEWRRQHGINWTVRWGILDKLHVQQAELHFEIDVALTRPTIVALYRRKLIYRVDIVPQSESKPNPFGAMRLGLPPVVNGSHSHPWPENRGYVADNGFGELPYRKPVALPDAVFIRALEVAADDLNIHVTATQRLSCEPPRQGAFWPVSFR